MEKVSSPLISVIVPVYNVEKYLEKCVNSITNQTYKNLEIILIDDGSKDNCPKICDNLAKKDKRIKVVHKENGGLSDARNKGIDIATGEYLTFVDSDDELTKSFIEDLYNEANINNTMITVAPYIIVTDKKKIDIGKKYTDTVLEQEEALKRMLLDDGYTVSACSKLYHKNLFKNIRYPYNKIFEDTATTYKLILKCNKISYIHKGGYYYYKRNDSIINSNYNDNQLLFIKYTDDMANEILKKYPNLFKATESKRIDARFSIYRRLIMIDKPNDKEKEIKKEIKKFILDRKKEIIFGKYNKKIKIATVLLLINEKLFKMFWKLYLKCRYN